MTVAYPLQWPDGWPRTEAPKRKNYGPFRTTFDKARRNLQAQLKTLGAKDVILSSWIELRRDGEPRADMGRRRLEDPGVAVYFTLRGKPMVIARDVYWSVHDNMHSIGHAIEHLRGLERHGGAYMMERAFTGFVALSDKPHWAGVLIAPETLAAYQALAPQSRLNIAEQSYRTLAKRAGGATVELNLAIAQARKELSNHA